MSKGPVIVSPTHPIVCLGSALWDIIARTGSQMHPGADVPGQIGRQMGGVALNVALALRAQSLPVRLLSVVGKDVSGTSLIEEASRRGIDCSQVLRTDAPTDTYLAIESKGGEVFAAIADCASLERAGADVLHPLEKGDALGDTPYTGHIIVDGNLPVAVLTRVASLDRLKDAHLAYVPASPGKAARLRDVIAEFGGTLYVNRVEAEILCQRALSDASLAAEALVRLGADTAIVTDGARRVAQADQSGLISRIPPKVQAISTTGAGDTFLAGHVAAQIAGLSAEDALEAAMRAAASHITRTKS